VEVVGLPGHLRLWVYRADDGGWRTLWPVRGVPVRLPERPPVASGAEPAIGAVLTAMVGDGRHGVSDGK